MDGVWGSYYASTLQLLLKQLKLSHTHMKIFQNFIMGARENFLELVISVTMFL